MHPLSKKTPKKKSSLRYSPQKSNQGHSTRLERAGSKPITDNHRWTEGDDQVKAGLPVRLHRAHPHPTSMQIPTGWE